MIPGAQVLVSKDAKIIHENANNGDEKALEFIFEYLDYLARGLSQVINIIDPGAIVLGGGVMNQKHLFEMIRLNVEDIWNGHTPLGDISNLISEPALDDNSGIVGSLSLAL